MSRLRTADRRAIRMGGIVIAALIVAFRGLPALASWRSRALDRATALEVQVNKTRALLDADKRQSRRSAATVTDTTSVFATRTLAEGSSELAAIVGEHAEAMGVQLSVIEPLVDSLSEGMLHRVRVRCEGQTDIAGLAGLLSLIATDERTMHVPRLGIVASNPQDDDTVPERLRLDFVVEALVSIQPGRRDATP